MESRVIEIGEVLINPKYPLKKRFRALFTLKNIGGENSIEFISKCFNDKSALLKHELAYCLGQMRDTCAVSKLINILVDDTQEVIVRHEAAEALGAIGDPLPTDILIKYQKSDIKEISETCELALNRLKHSDVEKKEFENEYGSVDPAPASCEKDVRILTDIYLDENKPIFERYQAMFALRNLNKKNSTTEIIVRGFQFKSALFRHEVAFVLGQLQDPVSIPALEKVVSNVAETGMVRHEAIEALGSIGSSQCKEIIQRYLNDEDDLVRESCEVALDIHTYHNSSEFQYANGLEIIRNK